MFVIMLGYSICRTVVIMVYRHGRPQGGGARGGTCPPPLEIKNYGGPHKDNLTRKNLKKYFFKLSEETELRALHLVSEETDMRGAPYSK